MGFNSGFKGLMAAMFDLSCQVWMVHYVTVCSRILFKAPNTANEMGSWRFPSALQGK